MTKVSKFAPRGKARDRKREAKPARPRGAGVPLAIRGPIYAASLGLLAVYAHAYLHAGIGYLAFALIGVTVMSELLKPALGELAAVALEARDRGASLLVAGAAVVCVILGAAGGLVAMHVAEAPRARWEAAERAVAGAAAAVAAAQRLVDGVPTCTPDMPASRCDRMTAENAAVLAERRTRLAAAGTAEASAQRVLDALPDPGPGLPHVELWQKALFVGGAEFLAFSVPFTALRLRRRETAATAKTQAKGEAAPERTHAPSPDRTIAPAQAAKVNDGGWATRRAKYGQTGRKQRRGAHLKVVAA